MLDKTINDLSILVVEDDIDTLSLLDIFLNEKFGKVYTSTNSEDAISKFQENKIDIVISDINLPIKNGIDLSKEIRAIDKLTPIILVTAIDNKELILEALHVGVNHYLFKPVIYDEFSLLLEDISNKVLVRQKLEYKNTLLLDAVEHSSEIVAIVDKDLLFEYVNPKFEQLLGYRLKLIENTCLRDLISFQKHDEMFYKDLISYINLKKIYKGSVYLEAIDKAALLFDFTITPNIDENGIITNFIINGESIDEITEVKKELEEKTSLFLSKATNAATEDMIKKLSHHWRQPLGVISATLQNIQISFELNEINKNEITESIKQSLDKLQKLSDTIDFFYDKYQNENNKKDIHLDRFVKESFTFIQNYLLQSDVNFEFYLDGDEEIFICKKNVFELLTTIVDNANEEFEQTDQENKLIKVTTRLDQEYAYIEVFNNGRNINESIKHKIFEPYFSTKHVKSGSGLGLYISKEIAEKVCKGKLYFENKIDGVSFIIQLPKEQKES